MNQLRCAYAGAVFSSGLTPGASEKALLQVSPVKAIPCFRPRRFPHSKSAAAKASPPMKMPTVIASRCFLLTFVMGSWAITPTLLGDNAVPPSAVALGLKAPPPNLVISEPTKTPYVSPKPPAPLSTVTLTFSDFTPYVSSGTTQGWEQGSTPQTILIPAQPK
jgi:hypothetical protein